MNILNFYDISLLPFWLLFLQLLATHLSYISIKKLWDLTYAIEQINKYQIDECYTDYDWETINNACLNPDL